MLRIRALGAVLVALSAIGWLALPVAASGFEFEGFGAGTVTAATTNPHIFTFGSAKAECDAFAVKYTDPSGKVTNLALVISAYEKCEYTLPNATKEVAVVGGKGCEWVLGSSSLVTIGLGYFREGTVAFEKTTSCSSLGIETAHCDVRILPTSGLKFFNWANRSSKSGELYFSASGLTYEVTSATGFNCATAASNGTYEGKIVLPEVIVG
jgi:hypothetical protein